MDNAVALAAIALAASSVTGLIWLAKFVAKTLGEDLREHTKAAIKQSQAAKEQAKESRKAAEASQEVLDFMKRLNGKLPKITHERMEKKRKDRE